MSILIRCGRELTKAEMETIAHFRLYLPDVDFALIGERTVMALLPGDEPIPTDDPDALEQTAKERMREHLCSQPNFQAYVMDDGYALTQLLEYCMTVDRLRDGEEEDGVAFGHAVQMRGECLQCCEEETVYAICLAERPGEEA